MGANVRDKGLGLHGDDVDFDESVFWEACDFDGRTNGRDDAFGREIAGVDLVHSSEVADVFEVDGGFDDVGHVEAGFGEDGDEVVEDAGGLGFYSTSHNRPSGRIECDLAGGVEGVAYADGLRIRADGGRSKIRGDSDFGLWHRG